MSKFTGNPLGINGIIESKPPFFVEGAASINHWRQPPSTLGVIAVINPGGAKAINHGGQTQSTINP